MTIYRKRERGFSYIDVMIAIVILMVGVLAMLSALTANLIRSYESEKRIVAKQLALSSLESIISEKEINSTNGIKAFDSIRNSDAPPITESDGTTVVYGIFLPGFNPVREDEGQDGVVGTADDACPTGSSCPGVAGYTNTSLIKSGFERQVIITDVPDSERPAPPYAVFRRRIEVHIKFFSNQLAREEVASTIVTHYETSN